MKRFFKKHWFGLLMNLLVCISVWLVGKESRPHFAIGGEDMFVIATIVTWLFIFKKDKKNVLVDVWGKEGGKECLQRKSIQT